MRHGATGSGFEVLRFGCCLTKEVSETFDQTKLWFATGPTQCTDIAWREVVTIFKACKARFVILKYELAFACRDLVFLLAPTNEAALPVPRNAGSQHHKSDKQW